MITIEYTTTVYMEGLTYINGYIVLGDTKPTVQYVYINSVSLQYTSVRVFAEHIAITDCIWYNGDLNLHMYSSGNRLHNITIQGCTVNYLEASYLLNGALNLECIDLRTTVSLTDVTIANNNVNGIAIDICAVEFGNVTISNNHSPFNGGGILINSGLVIFSKPNTTISFINNTAKGVGGAIYFARMTTYGNSFCTFANCICCLLIRCSFQSNI